MANAKKNSSGILKPRTKECLAISVSPESLERALCIADSIIKSMEQFGFPVSVLKQDCDYTTVTVLNEQIGFRINEQFDSFEKELTPRQQRERERYSWRYYGPEYIHKPNGKLTLHIEMDYHYGLRKQWCDTTKQKLEDCIGRFLIGLVKVAVAIKERRLAAEEWKRQLQEAQRLRAEQAKREADERNRIEHLNSQLGHWKKSSEIREYLKAAELYCKQVHGGWDTGSEFEQWLQWAYNYADQLDPLNKLIRKQ